MPDGSSRGCCSGIRLGSAAPDEIASASDCSGGGSGDAHRIVTDASNGTQHLAISCQPGSKNDDIHSAFADAAHRFGHRADSAAEVRRRRSEFRTSDERMNGFATSSVNCRRDPDAFFSELLSVV
jgi:hypothetical protein